jgi:hypothetical protein
VEESDVQKVAGKTGESCGWSAYHQLIYSALLRELADYDSVWNGMVDRCRATGFEEKFAHLFDPVEEASIPVLLLAHSLVEALANWYLAMKCDVELFAGLERWSVMRKWALAPRFWLPEYSLPKDGELSKDLHWLIARRNRIAHPKADIETGGRPVHKGNYPEVSDTEHDHVVACGALPRRLVTHLQKFDSASYVRMMSFALESKEGDSLNRLRREKLRR